MLGRYRLLLRHVAQALAGHNLPLADLAIASTGATETQPDKVRAGTGPGAYTRGTFQHTRDNVSGQVPRTSTG